MRGRVQVVICIAFLAISASAAQVAFVEDFENHSPGDPLGSPWYVDPHMADGSLEAISGPQYNRFPYIGNQGCLVNDGSSNGRDAGNQARLVPSGLEVEATNTAKLKVEYWAKHPVSKRAEWNLEISAGDVHAPRLADVGLYNPLPSPIPVLAFSKAMLVPGFETKATYVFDGQQWWPYGFLDYNDGWQKITMTVDSDSAYVDCGCNNSSYDIPRLYLGRFDRVSLYTQDYIFLTNYTVIDDVSIIGGNIVHLLRVTPDQDLLSVGPPGGPFSPQCRTYTLTNIGDSPLDWTAAKNEAWLSVEPAGGTLAAGSSVDVAVCINGESLPLGPYADVVTFTNTTLGDVQTRNVQLYVGHVDTFTELFTGNNDLANTSLLLTPDGSVHHYQACNMAETTFPYNPAGSVVLSLANNDSVKATLTQGATVRLYGQEYSEFYVGSNGYITFGSGDTDATESLEDHFSRPRISGLFADLDPGTGTVSWRQLRDRAVVTWQNVALAGTSNLNSFQIEMFFDGRIRMTWLGLTAANGLAGLSRGTGIPGDYLPSNLNSYASCPAVAHPADYDRDDDVDQADFGRFQACMTGPNLGPPAATCEDADLDYDNDVDASDLGIFQGCLTGSQVSPDPNCTR